MHNEKKMIMYLKLDSLVPHPQNPRKELGDLTELADSIKAVGIMQNLTVVPEDEEWNSFRIVIGHRRAAAAGLAGLEEVPCVVIEHMDEKEQLATMLLENIQRSDLTVIEQAEGFQMMIDIGSSITEISRRTGFGETTIRHRVKLLELDKKLLEEKQPQMKINDMIYLEKIKDPKRRETVLKLYGGSANFAQRVDQEAQTEAQQEKKEQVIKLLEERGLKEVKEAWKFDRKGEVDVNDFDEDAEIPEGAAYYSPYLSYDGRLILYGERERNNQPEESAEAQEERKRIEDARERYRSLETLYGEMNERMADFVLSFKSFDDEQKIDIQKSAQMHMLTNSYIDIDEVYDFLYGIGVLKTSRADLEEGKDIDEACSVISDSIEMVNVDTVWIAVLLAALGRGRCTINSTWRGVVTYNDNTSYKAIADLIVRLGYELSEEEEQLLNGTHKLFDREEEDESK